MNIEIMALQNNISINSFGNDGLFDLLKNSFKPFNSPDIETLENGKSFQSRKRKKKKKQNECRIKKKEPKTQGISPFAFLAFSLISINTVMNIINAINNNNNNDDNNNNNNLGKLYELILLYSKP